MKTLVSWRTALEVAADERGEVNTAAILAWTVLAVVAIAAVNVVFGDLVDEVFAQVKETILGIEPG